MTEQIEIRIPLSDLTNITMECPHCKAETTLDISNPKQRGIKKDPKQRFVCTVCMHAFDSRLRDAMLSIFAWYDSIKAANLIETLSFRIKKAAQ